MAIKWGAWKSTSTQSARVGIDASVSNTTSSSTITLRYYVQFSQAVSDNQTLTLEGTVTGTYNFHNSGGTILVATRTTTQSRYYGSTRSFYFKATLTGVYNGLTPWASRTVSIPARSYYTPYPPKDFRVVRDHDGRHLLYWDNSPRTGNDGPRPWDGVRIERWDNVGGSYIFVSNASPSAESGHDIGTRSDRRYRWRMRSYNSVGSSSWVYSDYLRTSPAAPSNLSAERDGGDIVVTWTNNSGVQTGVQLSHDEGNGWGQIVATSGSSYRHTSPTPGRDHDYRVRSYTNDPRLYSGYVYLPGEVFLAGLRVGVAMPQGLYLGDDPVSRLYAGDTALWGA